MAGTSLTNICIIATFADSFLGKNTCFDVVCAVLELGLSLPFRTSTAV